mgnify:FL=1
MLKWVFLTLYVVMMLGIGILSMKKASTLQDFFLGGRKMGPWFSAFAYGTTYFSAVIFIGYAGKTGWGFGLSAVWVGIGNAVLGSLLAWLILAKKTREMTQRLDVSTMPEFFEKRYDSKFLKVVSALIIFIFLVPYSASVYAGLSYLFESIFHIPYIYCMLFMAILTGIYLILGGYMATAMTDFIQGIIMIIGVVLMIVLVIIHPNVGGLSEGIKRLSQIPEAGSQLVSLFGGSNWFGLLSLVLLTSFGSWGLPQMVHKFYAIKDEKSIKSATVISTAFAVLIAGGAYFVGAFGRLFLNNTVPVVNGKENFDMIMPQMLIIALPDAVMSIILLLVLSASMSTLASIVLTSSSAISMDLVKGTLFPNMKKENVMFLMRVLCLVFIIFSFAVAYKPNAILVLMSFSWGTVAGSFISPYLYGLYWKGTTKLGAWAGMLGGFLTSMVLAISNNFDAGKAPLFGVQAMLASIIIVPVVSLLTPKLSSSHIAEVFNIKPMKGHGLSVEND